MEQLKLCIETAGLSMDPPPSTLSTPYFPKNPPAGIFVNVPAWHFDIEVDCIAAVVDKD